MAAQYGLMRASRTPAPESFAPQDWNPNAGVWVLICACLLVEIVLLGAEAGFWGSPRWRTIVIQNAAFWSGLLYDWRPNYAAQPATMFVTYALLHASWGHLTGNMAALYVLGLYLRNRASTKQLLSIYALSALGGAVAFAVLNQSPFPMVGASGAVFGLLGALIALQAINRSRTGHGSGRTIRDILLIGLFNLLVWFWLDGFLAWEAHLGGFLTGAIVIWVWPTTSPADHQPEQGRS